jgi:hypothetical protein
MSSELGLKNGYIVCSHPLIFGFTKMRIFDKVGPSKSSEIIFSMKTSLMNSNEIRFLIRYEIE